MKVAALFLWAAAGAAVARGDAAADVSRLNALASACAAQKSDCKSDAVGRDVTVGSVGAGGYVVQLDWMRDALRYASDKDKERIAAMDAVRSRLSAMTATESANAGTAKDQEAVADVLSHDEFSASTEPSLWQRFLAKLSNWLFRLYSGVDSLGSTHPWLGTLLEWLLFVGAGAGVAMLLIRNVRLQRLEMAQRDGGGAAPSWARESTAWAVLAEERARDGAWRDAIHCLFWAAIVQLEGERAFRRDASRTPREYLRLLEPGTARRHGLAALVGLLERTWYGLREASETEYLEARDAFAGLRAGNHPGEARS